MFPVKALKFPIKLLEGYLRGEDTTTELVGTSWRVCSGNIMQAVLKEVLHSSALNFFPFF